VSVAVRTSLTENIAMKNTNNGYNRCCFPRLTDGVSRVHYKEGQVMYPDNNRYGLAFSASKEDDFTTIPHVVPDHVILAAAIVDIVYAMNNNIDNVWYSWLTENALAQGTSFSLLKIPILLKCPAALHLRSWIETCSSSC